MEPGVDWEAEAEKWKRQARKHEDRAKANASAAKELEELRRQSMTDQDKAVAEAKASARAEVITEVAGRVVRAEVRAAAAGRLADEAVTVLVGGMDVSAFIDADGEVDSDKIAAFVDGIAPAESPPPFPELGQGARGPTALNGDPLLRDVKAKLGIR